MYCIVFFISYDVIFSADPETIIKKFIEFNSKSVFSAEQFCWPDQSLAVSILVYACCIYASLMIILLIFVCIMYTAIVY